MPAGAFLEGGMSAFEAALAGYAALADGWDGPGSKAAPADSLDSARRFLGLLPHGIPVPKPMLSREGRFGLYWESDATYADVQFEAEGMVSIFLRGRWDDAWEAYEEIHASDLRTESLEGILGPLVAA